MAFRGLVAAVANKGHTWDIATRMRRPSRAVARTASTQFEEESESFDDDSYEEMLPSEILQGEKDKMTRRQRFYASLDDATFSKFSMIYTAVNFTFILISTVTFLLSTTPEYTQPWVKEDGSPFPTKSLPLEVIEYIVISFFTFDYLAKFILWEKSRFLWFVNFLNLVDFLAIVPFYIELILKASGIDGGVSALVVLRVLRLFRVFRILKLAKFSKQLPVATKAVVASASGFGVALFTTTITVILCSSAMYYAETSVCTYDTTDKLFYYPDGTPTQFQSIPHTMWWCLVTLTTVGYGDMFPVSVLGKVINVVTMLCGILVLAFPLTILSSNFQLEFDKHNLQESLEAKQKAYLKWNLKIKRGEKVSAMEMARGMLDRSNSIAGATDTPTLFDHVIQLNPKLSERKVTNEMWDQLIEMRSKMNTIQNNIVKHQKAFDSLEHCFRHVQRKIEKREDLEIRAERALKKCSC
eukprot:TRINITY_DN11515_c0_g1_i1.p1 TRINITY_DN11515_c0_g1~~TRINITY_DN11515_c0_g1_i1.p1  ORF type:complete len:489 (+),score=106.66 TRINITY_DN11515_c0_g1_i1:66-1469(+)